MSDGGCCQHPKEGAVLLQVYVVCVGRARAWFCVRAVLSLKK